MGRGNHSYHLNISPSDIYPVTANERKMVHRPSHHSLKTSTKISRSAMNWETLNHYRYSGRNMELGVVCSTVREGVWAFTSKLD